MIAYSGVCYECGWIRCGTELSPAGVQGEEDTQTAPTPPAVTQTRNLPCTSGKFSALSSV